MNYHTETSYVQTKGIMLGEKHLPPFWQNIVDWVGVKFGVRALNIELGCYDEGNRQDIGLILERNADCVKLQDQHDNEIAAYIMPLLYLPERPTDDETKNEILPWKNGRPLVIHIDCYSFEKIHLMDLSEMLTNAASKQLKKKYGKLIAMTTHNSGTQHIFYHRDADVIAGRTNGVSDAIKQIYFDALKSLDKFGYYTIDDVKMIFDSQETLDRDHGGNTGYYFR